MSRQNKVNPGMYTQRGRLTPDDAARELQKQRAIRSPHTWQPENTKAQPWLAPSGAAPDTKKSADSQPLTETPLPPAKVKARAPKKSKKTTGRAQTGKSARSSMTKTPTKAGRKAVTAKAVRGRRAASRAATTRRRS